jgi:predicted amidohydrolase YtcJ
VKDWPTHEKLTAVSPNNPVYLTRVDGHAALVNKAALDAAKSRRPRRIRLADASSETPNASRLAC